MHREKWRIFIMDERLFWASFEFKEKSCYKCNNPLTSIDELFEKKEFEVLQKNFRENMGGKEFPSSACTECNSVYDKYYNKKDYSLGFLKRFLDFNNPQRQS